jgi:hypothetical protein
MTTDDGIGATRPRFSLLREAQAIVAGTIVCAAVIAAGAGHTPSIGALCVAIVFTVSTYWLAGIYAATMGVVIADGAPVARAALGVARRSWHVLVASLVPVVILTVSAALGAQLPVAATIALVATVGLLAVYGFLAGRAGGFGIGGCVASAVGGAGLGLLIVLLKSVLS